jgi:hypothetical protein
MGCKGLTVVAHMLPGRRPCSMLLHTLNSPFVTFAPTGRGELSWIAHNKGLAIKETTVVNMVINLSYELRTTCSYAECQ